jgi:hypothetical protein
MQIGNMSINVIALGSITKQEFINSNRGKILNIEIEANKLSKHFKKEEVVRDVVQNEKPKRKRKRK